MSGLDVEKLLEPISADFPCGEDLEYDAAFAELDRAGQGKPEQQYGDTIIPAEDPDWREVKKLATGLTTRTKDLRVLVQLALASLATEGWTGFSAVVQLMRGYVEQYWEGIFPLLDADDDNDPTERVNTLSTFNDLETTLNRIRTTPLVKARALGQFSLRDIAIAKGELSLPEGAEEEAPKMSTIDAAFMDCELQDLQETTAAIAALLENVRSIEAFVMDKVGAANAVNLEDLIKDLKHAHEIVAQRLESRGGTEVVDEADAEDGGELSEAGDAPGQEPGQAAGEVAAPAVVIPKHFNAEIQSREDVTKALDKICQYYERYEPSSPLPMLLHRARRLAAMNFLDILQDIAPDGINQAQFLGGVNNGETQAV